MFDDIIKNKANEHEFPVPPDAWDNIIKKKKKRRAAFGWWGGAALLLLGLSTAGYFFMAPEKSAVVSEMREPATPLPKSNDAAAGITTITKEQEAKPVNNTLEQVVSETNNPGNNKNFNNASGNFNSKKKIAVSITNPEAAANEQVLYKPGKKTSKHKGRLSLQQTVPQTEEESIQSKKDNEEIVQNTIRNKKENITVEENNIITIAGIPDKETPPADKVEKKAADVPGSKTNDKKENSTKKHWFIEAMASPLLSSSTVEENIVFNRTLAINNSTSVYNGKLIKTSIEPAVAFSLAVRRELNKKWSIVTGLQYLQLKENISIEGKETITLYTPVQRLMNGQLVADTVITITEGTRSIDAVNSYQLISIPVFAQYNVVQKKQWNVGAVGGVYLNLSSQYQNEIDRNAAAPLTTGRTEKNTGMGMDLFTGVRVGKTLGKRLEFFAMPSMRWNLTKYNIKNSLLDKNIRQAGVGFGVCYTIK